MSNHEYYTSSLEGLGRIPTPFDGIICRRALWAAGSGNPDQDEALPTPTDETGQDTTDKVKEEAPLTGKLPNNTSTKAEGGGDPF
jgi:hypothetical protein